MNIRFKIIESRLTRSSFYLRALNTLLIFGLFLVAVGHCTSAEVQQQRLAEERQQAQHLAFFDLKFDVLPGDRGEKRQLRAEHYPASNERRIDLFYPHLQNLGGGYIGVGTDQNLTFIAWAKSEYAWLIDFDWVSVFVNRIHFLFIEHSTTYEEYRALWDAGPQGEARELIKAAFTDPNDLEIALYSFGIAHRRWSGVPDRLRALDLMTRRHNLNTFNTNPEHYNYIRQMVIERRIQAIPGDLRGDKTMQSIAATAKRMELPIRIVYTSNAEEYFRYPEGMRDNFLALPVDEKGLLVRTATSGAPVYGYPDGEMFPEIPFHYNIQPLHNLQEWMRHRSHLSIRGLLNHRTPNVKGFSILEKTPQEAGLKETDRIDRP